ncbi:hypothetical protein COLO4_16361 [Corchorus olitorius]|uniref:Uncharacterized protein n=1 Tax=Corchorus olitorius TaxID=93759 RepID=A0A1R3JHT6_9ROSI|nr:hypothetical protein COLO4_16361 [Corchorus olitorius]
MDRQRESGWYSNFNLLEKLVESAKVNAAFLILKD